MRLVFVFLMFPIMSHADGYGFMTPSGNIVCNGAVMDGYIACSIIERSGAPALPKPTSCSGIWGHGITLDRTGEARLTCDNKPPKRVNYSDITGYGQTSELGPIKCTSERTGLTCRNQSGHGFSCLAANKNCFEHRSDLRQKPVRKNPRCFRRGDTVRSNKEIAVIRKLDPGQSHQAFTV